MKKAKHWKVAAVICIGLVVGFGGMPKKSYSTEERIDKVELENKEQNQRIRKLEEGMIVVIKEILEKRKKDDDEGKKEQPKEEVNAN